MIGKATAAFYEKVARYGAIVAVVLISIPVLGALSDLAGIYQVSREGKETILAFLNNRNYTMPVLFILAILLLLLNRRLNRIKIENLWKERYDRLVTLAEKQRKTLGQFVFADQIRCTYSNSIDTRDHEIRFHIRIVNASVFDVKIDPTVKGRVVFNRSRLAGAREFEHTSYEIEAANTHVVHLVQQLTPDDRDLIKVYDGNIPDAIDFDNLKIGIRPTSGDQPEIPAYVSISQELKLQRD